MEAVRAGSGPGGGGPWVRWGGGWEGGWVVCGVWWWCCGGCGGGRTGPGCGGLGWGIRSSKPKFFNL